MRIEDFWREVDAKWGLLTGDQVMNVLRVPEGDRATVARMRVQGQLLTIKFQAVHVYPGFQFDFEAGRVKAVVPDLVKLALDVGWTQDDLVMWLCSPTTYFGGDRPVEHLNECAELLEKTRNAATVEW